MVSLQITIYGLLLTVSLLTTNANAGEFLQKIKSSLDSRTVRHKKSVDKLIHEAPNRIFDATLDHVCATHNHTNGEFLPFLDQWLATLKAPAMLLSLEFHNLNFQDRELHNYLDTKQDVNSNPTKNLAFTDSKIIAKLLRDFVQDVHPIRIETALKIEAIVINENDSDANLKSVRDILSAELTSNENMLLKKLFTFSAYWADYLTTKYSPESANFVYPEIAYLFFRQEISDAETQAKMTAVVTYLSVNVENIFENIN